MKGWQEMLAERDALRLKDKEAGLTPKEAEDLDWLEQKIDDLLTDVEINP